MKGTLWDHCFQKKLRHAELELDVALLKIVLGSMVMLRTLLLSRRVLSQLLLVLRLISLTLRVWDSCMVPHFLALLKTCGFFLSLSSEGLFL